MTGIPPIDDQHRRIVDFINQLETVAQRREAGETGAVLAALADYCDSHFAFEESLQEKAGYKFAEPHKSIHCIFIKRLAKYQEKHDAGEDVAQQLHGMLSTWLIQHIKRDDMAYVPDVRRSIVGMARDEGGGDWLSRSVSGFFGKGH